MQRDRMNRIDGQGEMLSAKAESMNRTMVFALSTTSLAHRGMKPGGWRRSRAIGERINMAAL